MEDVRRKAAYAWIAPPYVKCPRCGKEAFGISMICSNHYTRRCAECWFPPPDDLGSASFPLPKLHKKIVYLDQFVVSEMMKALNPATKAHQAGKVDPFWFALFEKLHKLCKLQLIVCPYSGFHRHESIVSRFYESLRTMYELLGHGGRFADHDTIIRFQVCEHARLWLKGQENQEPVLDRSRVIEGDFNGWQERYILSVNPSWDESWITELRASREARHVAFDNEFKKWGAMRGVTFDELFDFYTRGFGTSRLAIYHNNLRKYKEAVEGEGEFTLSDLMEPAHLLVQTVEFAFQRAGMSEIVAWDKTQEYFLNAQLKYVPYVRISSLLFAAMAARAAKHQEPRPNRGTLTDISIVSMVLPYCDAVFIDNHIADHLLSDFVKHRLGYTAHISSWSRRQGFMEYLEDVEKSASQEHLARVREVYGDGWLEPYLDLYKKP